MARQATQAKYRDRSYLTQGHQLQARSKGAHKNVAMALLAMRGEMQPEVAGADEQQRKMSSQRKEEVVHAPNERLALRGTRVCCCPDSSTSSQSIRLPCVTCSILQAAILFAQLDQVKQNVSSLRDMIESRGTGQEYVDTLRSTMDTVENEIYVVRQVKFPGRRSQWLAASQDCFSSFDHPSALSRQSDFVHKKAKPSMLPLTHDEFCGHCRVGATCCPRGALF